MSAYPALLANVKKPQSESVWLDIYTQDGTPVLVNLDTGSNGLVLPYEATHDANGNLLPWIVSTGVPMTREYHPSGFTVEGVICKISGLYFLGSNNEKVALNEITALVCNKNHGGAMLGIGMGLLPPSPDQLLDNPLLNVTGQNPSFNLALTAQNPNQMTVTLGQPASELTGYSFLELTANSNAASGYAMPNITITLTPPNSANAVKNTYAMLMDCGIPGMYLSGTSIPSVGSGNSLVPALMGYTIELAAANQSFSYQFTVGNPSTGNGAPTFILQGGNDSGFVNTGINFLQAYNYYFDAKSSQLGFLSVG
jgi:hypothetical protein